MSTSFNSVMKSPKNGRREVTTRVCFSPDITVRFNELEAELTDALYNEDQVTPADAPKSRKRLADPESGPAAPLESKRIAGDMAKLIEDNPDSFYDVKFGALPGPKWTALRSEHPPRDDHAEDAGSFNSETFRYAAVRACMIDPDPTDEVIDFFINGTKDAGHPEGKGGITSGEWERLTLVVWGLNEGAREVPKLERALSILNGNANG